MATDVEKKLAGMTPRVATPRAEQYGTADRGITEIFNAPGQRGRSFTNQIQPGATPDAINTLTAQNRGGDQGAWTDKVGGEGVTMNGRGSLRTGLAAAPAFAPPVAGSVNEVNAGGPASFRPVKAGQAVFANAYNAAFGSVDAQRKAFNAKQEADAALPAELDYKGAQTRKANADAELATAQAQPGYVKPGGMAGSNDDTAPIKNAKYLQTLAEKDDRPGAIRFLTSNSLIRQKNDYVQDAVKLAGEAYTPVPGKTFDAKQAALDAKQAWDDSVDEMLISAGFPGKPVPPPLSGMAFAPTLARPAYNGPVPAGAPAGMAAPVAKAPVPAGAPAGMAAPTAKAPVPAGAPVATAAPAKAKPAPDVVVSQARAALTANIPRAKVMARMEELYPGLSQQL